MQLSDDTVNVLKNFSGINQNIMIRQGNTLKTISEAHNILAHAHVAEEFPQDFGIYDLNEFIGVMGLVDSPNLEFNNDFVKVGDASGRSNVKYYFSSPDTLTTPNKDITMPSSEVKFTLDGDTLNKLKSAASALGHNEVSIKPNNGVLTLYVIDNENSTSNAYQIDIDGEYDEGANFNFVVNIGNLKIIPGDYEVQISTKLISQFSHKDMNVHYWIALEKTSTFGA